MSTQHVSTVIGPQALNQPFSEDLLTLESLPGTVRFALGSDLPVKTLADLLQKAGQPEQDSGEPSWSVLAHLIRETQFVQTWRRLHFMKVMWSVPVGDYWNEVKADVASHRYLPYLETLALPSQVSSPAFSQFAGRIDLSDIERRAGAMMVVLSKYPAERGKAVWRVANSHGDNTTGEMAEVLPNVEQAYRLKYAENLMEICSDHPLAQATLIELSWDKVKDKVGQWEKQAPNEPSILAALGKHWFDAKNYEEARRVMKRYIEQTPDLWGYQMVADGYKAQGDMSHCQETLDDFLSRVEDLGLDHARVRVDLAEYFMSRKEWDKAVVYAEDAAESWAEWAMNCAIRCDEGARRWEQAETWIQRKAERYTGPSFAWYLFCKRTGHGKIAAVREYTERYIHSPSDNVNRDVLEGCFCWLEGQHEKARTMISKSYNQSKQVGSGLCLAVLEDKAGDASRRNTVLKEVIASNKQTPSSLSKALQYVLDTILDPGVEKKAFDPKQLDQRIEACPENNRSFAAFFIAGFLRNHGQGDEARKFYERCADSQNLWEWYRLIARDALTSTKGK